MKQVPPQVFPVKVIFVPGGGPGTVVELVAPFPLSWKGIILLQRQSATTGRDGQAIFYLPPSAEMRWLDPPSAGNAKPHLIATVAGSGSFPLFVPSNQAEYLVGG